MPDFPTCTTVIQRKYLNFWMLFVVCEMYQAPSIFRAAHAWPGALKLGERRKFRVWGAARVGEVRIVSWHGNSYFERREALGLVSRAVSELAVPFEKEAHHEKNTGRD